MFAAIISFLVSGLVIMLGAYIIPGVSVDGYLAALIAALATGLVNAVIRPLLILFTLPLNILTLGLFTFVINALLVLLVSAIVPGFSVDGFLAALLFSLIISVLSALIPKE